jgi:hypothetical protein
MKKLIFPRTLVNLTKILILTANPIDWLYAACLEYFIFFSNDSSEARKQYDEYCLSIMHMTERIFKAPDG